MLMGVAHSEASNSSRSLSADARRPLLPRPDSLESVYGAMVGSHSPERISELARVVEEEDDEQETWELEEQGFYRGSYRRIMAEYAIVPLSSLLVWLFFAALPSIAYHTDQPSDTPNRYPATFSTLLLGAALWTLSHMLRLPLYTFFAFISPNETAATLLSTAFHVVCRNFIRLAGLPLLLLRHAHPTWRDDAFGRVWCLALGCSFAEVVVACAQGFEQISLYRDVLVPYGRQGGEEDEGDMDLSASAKFQLRQQVERDVDHLLAFKAREEVEQIYGMPAIKIPVFVSCLQRIDAIILSLGLTLVISSAYLRSGISVFVTFPIAVALHLALSLLHTPMVLPRIGVHVAAYVGIIGGLGAFFAGLAMWGALS